MARILLVEDQPDIREMMRLRLELQDHQVEEAENGQEGVHKALSTPFDLILMDMHMPVMNGYDAVHALRRQGYTGMVVAVTASAMSEETSLTLTSGCNAFITKPIDHDFEERIQNLLDQG